MIGEMEVQEIKTGQAGQGPGGEGGAAAPPPRLHSLDALRGFDMLWITGVDKIVAALAAATGWGWLVWFHDVHLEHGPWIPPDYGRWGSGFHFYDMIMPLFMFCAGASMPFSFAKRASQGQSGWRIFGHVLIRVALLFILGSIHQGNLLDFKWSAQPSKQMLHLYCNTLQAIASGYLIASILVLTANVAGQVAATAVLIAAYWAILRYVPAPGGTPGVLTPESNIAIYLDKKLLGRFQDMTYYTWILSSMVFGATVMIGALAGRWLRGDSEPSNKGLGLLAAGVLLTGGGLWWSGTSPIVKYIWSGSFVLFSGGICLMLLGAFYLVVDVWGLRRLAFPFVVVGANAIVAYMANQFFQFNNISTQILGGSKRLLVAEWYNLARAGVAFAVLWFILYLMYKKKLFVRV